MSLFKETTFVLVKQLDARIGQLVKKDSLSYKAVKWYIKYLKATGRASFDTMNEIYDNHDDLQKAINMISGTVSTYVWTEDIPEAFDQFVELKDFKEMIVSIINAKDAARDVYCFLHDVLLPNTVGQMLFSTDDTWKEIIRTVYRKPEDLKKIVNEPDSRKEYMKIIRDAYKDNKIISDEGHNACLRAYLKHKFYPLVM